MRRKRENGCFRTTVEASLDIDFGQDTAGGCGGDTWQKKSRGAVAQWVFGGCGQGLQWVCIWVSAMASGFLVGVGAAFD